MKQAALLAGQFGDDEREDWWRLLTAALPAFDWWRDDRPYPAETITVAVVANPPPGRLRGLANLRLIQSLWAGVERLLRDDTLPPGVPICRMVDPAMNTAMAETALWAVLALQRDFFRYARQQAARQWVEHPQRRADEWRVTVLGQGEMGGTVSERLVRNGYVVAGWRRRDGADALPPLLARTDVLDNLLPLTPETAGVLDAALFAQLPRGAAVVNLARGGHLVEADLLAALASGQVGHAVLDVFATEPLPAGHAFWSHPQVTVLPHVAAQTDVRSAAEVAVANLRAFVEGAPLRHRVDRALGY